MIWSVVGPTLLKAACSVDLAVAKTSVEILRSIISHVLQEQPEPRHFHFNEAYLTLNTVSTGTIHSNNFF